MRLGLGLLIVLALLLLALWAWADSVSDARAALEALITERATLLKTITAKNAEIAALKSTVSSLQAKVATLQAKVPPDLFCTHMLIVGTPGIQWDTLAAGAVVCLGDGDHAFGIEPPIGLVGITVKAANWGKASVQYIDLANNSVPIHGVAVVHNGVRAVWSRVGP